jgi:hypothetical protein
MTAYDLKTYQVVGPAWMDTERYDVLVKVPVKVHHEPKEFQVEDLVIGKGGSKLKRTTLDPDAPLPAGPAT